MKAVELRPVGDAAFVVPVSRLRDAHRLWAALRQRPIAGVGEAVVGAQSVLINVDPAGCDEAGLRRVVESAAESDAASGRQVRIPVRYDGPDLDDVASASGLSVPEVIERHSGRTYTVAFLGFSPGFAYLTGLDPALVLPRRRTPRTAVPAGSVAIAGVHTAVYPQQTPGGWHLIGHSDMTIFDPAVEPPAILAPADTVVFEVIG